MRVAYGHGISNDTIAAGRTGHQRTDASFSFATTKGGSRGGATGGGNTIVVSQHELQKFDSMPGEGV